MKITGSLADFLLERLVCVYFTNGKRVYGIFKGKMEGKIILEKPYRRFEGLCSERVTHREEEIDKIKTSDDLRTAYALNVGMKFSKKVREALA